MVNELEIRLMPYQKEHIYDKALNMLVTGSAGAGKTIFSAYKTLFFAVSNPGSRLLVTRKSGPSLNLTCVFEIMKILNSQKYPFKFNANNGDLYLANGSVIHFKSIDVLEKFRSITVDFIWVEQAEEIKYADYQELKRRLRGEAPYLQFLLTFTPEDEYHWLYKIFYDPESPRKVNSSYIHFDYKSNVMLPDSYLEELEELKEMDPDLWRKYGLGEFGKISGLVYPNIVKITNENLPEGVMGGLFCAGVDWGFNNPNVFLLTSYYEGEYYILAEIYVRERTNPEFLSIVNRLVDALGIQRRRIYTYCDFTEPSKIQEFANAGYNTFPGCNNITERVDHVKRSKVFVHERCENTNSEQRSYKWAVDKNGEKLDHPVPYNDHSMNCIEYMVHGVNNMLGIKLPLDPKAIGRGIKTY